MTHDKKLGSNLKKIRKSKGVTLQELADKVKCHIQQIYNLESGRRKLTGEWMIKLAAALECNAVDFFDMTEMEN